MIKLATYKTQIQWGGPSGDWFEDADLVIEIKNRKDISPVNGLPATGTNISWWGPNGNGNITFSNNASSFYGTAQFPGEAPVSYRGKLKELAEGVVPDNGYYYGIRSVK